ncbi:MAG: hypothetical protein ACJ758_05705 [Actinomycetota bacterium]
MSPLRRGLVLLGLFVCAAPFLSGPVARASGRAPVTPLVVLVPNATLGDLLSIPAVRSLAHAGGAGFVSSSVGLGTVIERAFRAHGVSESNLPSMGVVQRIEPLPGDSSERGDALNSADAEIRHIVAETADHGPCVVIVSPPALTPAMVSAKDELTPVVAGRGADCQSLLSSTGPPRTITSDSTRRAGVVAQPDVPFEILTALGRTPSLGAEIRPVDAPPPFHLLENHLANRRMSVPIQTAAGIYVGIAGLFAALMLYRRRHAPRWLMVSAAWLTMSVAPLAIALLAAGRLPTLSYSTVVPFIVVVTVVVTLLADLASRRSVLDVPVAIGVVSIVYLAFEALFHWSGALTPFLGGSQLDGGRFFGLPNVYVGLLLGASLYVAQRLSVAWGVVLIVGVGFFAGLPGTGANIGGALTLFAAAGLWVVVRCRSKLGWLRAIGIAAAIGLVGMAAIFASHVYLTASPTHGTRFVEGAGRSASGVWDTVAHRLDVGFDLIARNPFALIPVVGLLVVLFVIFRPTPAIRESFLRHPVWRDAILVIVLGSIVAYVANDSGAAAVGLGFGLAVGGLLYVPLREEAGNMETR